MKRILLPCLILAVLVVALVFYRGRTRREVHPGAPPLPPSLHSPAAPSDGVAGGKGASETASDRPTAIPDNTPPEAAMEPPAQGAKRDLSGQIRQVIQADPSQSAQVDYQRRMRVAQGLGAHLTDEEVQALLAFLRAPPSRDATLDLLAVNSIKNEVLDALINQERLPAGLGLELARMAADTSLDGGIRDYCVQHFAPFVRELRKRGVVASESADYRAIRAGYDYALQQVDASLPGTALIGLYTLTEEGDDFPREEVSRMALQMGQDASQNANTRVTALQICGQMGMREALPTARMEAQSGETIQLRMAAIATLGDLGGKEDVSLVEALALEKDTRIQTSAQAALKRLNRRLEESPRG